MHGLHDQKSLHETCLRLAWIPKDDLAGFRAHAFQKLMGDGSLHEEARSGKAELSSIKVLAQRCCHRLLYVRVGKDHKWRFAT